jgi:hypothetical protein
MAKLELVSPHPVVECLRLLGLGLQQSSKVDGSISGPYLRARKRISYRNSFQIRLSADLIEKDGHTRIVCRFGMHPVVIAFLVFWFGALILIGGGGMVASVIELISGPHPDVRDLVGQLIPAMVLMFGVMIVMIARYLAAGERLVLTDFVRETLTASPCPQGSGSSAVYARHCGCGLSLAP